jgi:hypothetical protein
VDGGQPTGAEPCSWPRTALVPHPRLVPPREVTPPLNRAACFCASIPTPHPGTARGARGRERRGPTRSHPEPGRDPRQRRRVLWHLPWEARPLRAPHAAPEVGKYET